MASDDVIELGSSDEDVEPAPKKRKPPLNAMVHIPGKLPKGVTVTPSKNSKHKFNPPTIVNGAIGQAVTVTKITKVNINPFANVKKNGVPIKAINKMPGNFANKTLQRPTQKNSNILGVGIPIANAPRAFNLNKAIQHSSNINVRNVSSLNNAKVVTLSKPVAAVLAGNKKSNLKGTQLPPGITIKRTTPTSGGSKLKVTTKNLNPSKITGSKPIIKAGPRSKREALTASSVPTVNIDDDDTASFSSSGPQWYIRPEEQDKNNQESMEPQDPLAHTLKEQTNDDTESNKQAEKSQKTVTPEKSSAGSELSAMEQQNNKEPDKIKYIEITIEDSPIKPANTQKPGFKVGAELAITIEDSPVKLTIDNAPSDSDSGKDNPAKDRNSKKKLDYPKTVKTVQVVEIEFEPIVEKTSENNTEETAGPKDSEIMEKAVSPKETTSDKKSPSPTNTDKEQSKRVIDCIDIVEIEESPIKPIEEIKTTTPRKNKPSVQEKQTKPVYNIQQGKTIVLDENEKDEFSSVYQSFIKLCFELENSEDMKKIVEKKIKAYYRQVPKEYTESETFTEMVAGKVMAMKASPEKMYLYIKDVVDELNLQRKMAKSQVITQKEEQEKFLYGEESEFDTKRQRQIRKLEKTLKKLHRAIQKLEEQEVDFDDEEDSVYLLTERYKERSVRVHAKLCQLTNTKMPSEARVQIDSRPGQPKGPAKRLEKWINRKVPIGTPLPFPDFHDVLRCVREANQEDKLGWNEADVMEEARDLFVRCGKKLQRRRQENEWRLAASRIPADTLDPAEDSSDLKRKLEENRRLASKKETDVFNKYANRQNQLNLEAVEIGDKEAEESPVESDDEDVTEVTDSLTDKEKRKERLKKLIQQKAKGEKGNQSDHKSIEKETSKKDPDTSKKDAETSKKDAETSKKDADNDENKVQTPMETDSPDKEPPNQDLFNKDKKSDSADSDSSVKSKDSGNRVDSDIDELHLLEKLYSENEFNNSVVSSSDSPIAISDGSSLEDKMSDDERRKKPSSDVISIENSSYSESEERKADSSKDADDLNTEETDKDEQVNTEQKRSVDRVENMSDKIKYEESNSNLEDILMASSDEDSTKNSEKSNINASCINLRDECLSIGDTVIVDNRDLDADSEASNSCNAKTVTTDSSSLEGMEIGPIEINSEDQTKLDNAAESASVELFDDEIAITKSPKTNEDKSPAEVTEINSVETIEDDVHTETVNEITKEELDDNGKEKRETIQNVNEKVEEKSHKNEDEALLQNNGDISMREETTQDTSLTKEFIKNGDDSKSDKENNKKDNIETNVENTVSNCKDVPMDKEHDIIKIDSINKTVEDLPGKETANNNEVPEKMEVD